MKLVVTGEQPTDAVNVTGGQQATVIDVTTGTVSSVNGRTGPVTGLAEASAVTAEIGSAIAAHTAASDPHGDRAWAENTLTGKLGVYQVIGATGDGVTDDLAPLQAAVDRCSTAGGGTVLIPAGHTYGLSDYLYVPSNVTLYAYGATIKAIAGHGLVRLYRATDNFTGFNGHSNIRVLGGTWDANARDGSAGTVVGLVDAFTLGHNNDVLFRDVTIKNVSCAHAIDITASRNVRIINCRFLGFIDNTVEHSRGFSEAIQLDAALSGSGAIGAFDNTVTQDVLVQGCYFGSSERLGPFGRAVGSHTSVTGDYYDNIQILGCRIEGAGQEAIRPYAWRRAVIDGNIISGTGTSSIVITGPDPATAGYNLTSHMVTVANNIIEAPTANTPIRVVGFSAAKPTGIRIHGNTVINSPSTGIYVSFADRPAVTGNTAIGSASSSIYAISCTAPQIAHNMSVGAIGTAIGIDTCTGGSMIGNTIEGAASGTGHGCFVQASTDVTVTSNRVNAVRGSGIRNTSSALRTRILGNTVIRGGVTALGIDVTASATGALVINNDLTGGSWPAGTAFSFAAGANPITDWTGGTANPGQNLAN